MLSSITLNFTASGDLTVPATGITVFVGPNNSGKSLVLREIEQAFLTHPFPAGLKVLKDYEIKWPTQIEVEAALCRYTSLDRRSVIPENQALVGRINPSGSLEMAHVNKNTLFDIAEKKNNKHWLATQFLRWGVVRLDGRSRFNLTNDQSGGDLLAAPQNVLSHLFQDDDARKKVRALIKDAFGVHFVVDPTSLGQLRIRLSSEAPPEDEQSLNANARIYYKNAIHIKDASDGVQAFTGIITAVMSGEYHTILVDEPEAFLHPPLARKLGKHLATLAAERSGCLLASTHSPDFLLGCIQASKNVRVVRLEYTEGKSRGRMVDPDQLSALFKNPLMRSSNAFSGLFYDGVVVTESDNDRVFYGEIYHRMAAQVDGYPSLLFINAQNKQTIRDIIKPLREFGVPAAAIPDIDILKDGGQTWTGWLKAAHVPSALHAGYGIQRNTINACFDSADKNMKTDGGINALSPDDKLGAEQLFDNLEDYGIFTVRGGELEHWLKHLGVPGKKTDWAVAMLERLGSNPNEPSYVMPNTGDVWDFMRKVVKWVQTPTRKGTS